MKISVYLPDDLAARVREAKLPVSAICQAALDEALRDLAATDPFVDENAEVPPDFPLDGPAVRNLTAAVNMAYQSAATQGSATVETEDLLQGLLDEGENLMLQTLAAIGVEGALLQAAVDDLDRHREPLDPGAAPRLSERARRTANQASAEAARQGQPLNLAHLLLALLDDGGGGAGRALRAVGLDATTARRTIAAMESGVTFGRTTVQGLATARLERLLHDIVARLDRLEQHS